MGLSLEFGSEPKENGKDEMSYESKKRLDDIGFIWDPHAETWEAGFSKLLQFKKAEGHVNVPQRYNLDGFKLGAWVSNLRNARSTLSIERKQQLDEIGFHLGRCSQKLGKEGSENCFNFGMLKVTAKCRRDLNLTALNLDCGSEPKDKPKTICPLSASRDWMT